MCEWLVPLVSRALADQAEAARDAGNPDAAALDRLAALLDRFPEVLSDPGQTIPLMHLQTRAMQAWYGAEVARARQDPHAGSRWLAVAEAFTEAQLPWVEVYAWWRAAEALLGRGHEQRADGVRALRCGLALGRRLEAGPLLNQLEGLARTARVSLGLVPAEQPLTAAGLPGLTAREREILEHLVAGSTYAEIATALVISEKTVSSHVSNLLRKTGTASRVELSRLAMRVRPEATPAP